MEKTYSFDSTGFAVQVPDYQMVFNCTFPKTFRDRSFWWDDVIIESITYKYDAEYEQFKTYWTGMAGNTEKGPNYSTPRSVGYKLYDPEGYVISSGHFDTGVALKMGEKFKDKEKSIGGYRNVKTKGIYRLELMNEG